MVGFNTITRVTVKEQRATRFIRQEDSKVPELGTLIRPLYNEREFDKQTIHALNPQQLSLEVLVQLPDSLVKVYQP